MEVIGNDILLVQNNSSGILLVTIQKTIVAIQNIFLIVPLLHFKFCRYWSPVTTRETFLFLNIPRNT